MPWLRRSQYRSLLRAANMAMVGRGKDDNTFGLNKTGMLLWRLSPEQPMGGGSMLKIPFEFVEAVEGEENVIVFIVHHGKPVVIEDPMHMYPSDQLIQQLRLLL